MNALISLAVWCQPHGPVTVLTTQRRNPTSAGANGQQRVPKSKSAVVATTTAGSGGGEGGGKEGVATTSTITTTPTPSTPTGGSNGGSHVNNSNSNGNSNINSNSNSNSNSNHNSTLGNHPPPSQQPPHHLPHHHHHHHHHHHRQPSTGASIPGGPGGPPGGGPPGASPTSTSSSNPCECYFSLPTGERSLHSVDPNNPQLAYISQPTPVDAKLFAPIRMACIRSLNAEAYSGREGTVFFGDGVNGYVLSYMFTLFDAQSRGHMVKYTFLTMMTDRVFLVANMEFLISQFQLVVANLQAMANAQRPTPQSPASVRSFSYSSSHHRGSIIPDNGPTRRGRPLTDVLAKPDIFVRLHAAFVSILSSCSQRLVERRIHGLPIELGNRFEINSLLQPVGQADGFKPDHGLISNIESLCELRRLLGRPRFDRFIWNSLIGNQVIVRANDPNVIKEIVTSLEDILPKDCCTVILNGTSYEPSYNCNILGASQDMIIPTDLEENEFVLLDVNMSLFYNPNQPPISSSNGGDGEVAIKAAESWALHPDTTTNNHHVHPSNNHDNSNGNTKKSNFNETNGVEEVSDEEQSPFPNPSLYSPSGGFQAQRRTFTIKAGEDPPEPLDPFVTPTLTESKALKPESGGEINGGGGGGGRLGFRQSSQAPKLFLVKVNDILDQRLPRSIERQRFAILRQEWLSKSKQLYNMLKTGGASDEKKLSQFLKAMLVDPRDLKVLRFLTKSFRTVPKTRVEIPAPGPTGSSSNVVVVSIVGALHATD